VNSGRPQPVRTPAIEDAKIAAVERETWRNSGDIARGFGTIQTICHYYVLLGCRTSSLGVSDVSRQRIGLIFKGGIAQEEIMVNIFPFEDETISLFQNVRNQLPNDAASCPREYLIP
jgi:hypothetical protein